MSEALPKIKVTDSQYPEGNGTALDSPSTATDGGQTARPRSATSSEGKLCYFSACLIYGKPPGSACFQDVQMLWLLLLVPVLTFMLTIALKTGNTQSNGKKSPINNLIRNSPSRESNGSNPPAQQQARPTTAIDPLSHVCPPWSQVPMLQSKMLYEREWSAQGR